MAGARRTLASVPLSQVKALRERTAAGLLDCKRALEASGGDMDAAVEQLRAQGAALAAKVASRRAAEGTVAVAVGARGDGVLLEVRAAVALCCCDC